jgi:LysM domain
MKSIIALFMLVLSIVSQPAFGGSAAECNPLLKGGVFDTFIKNSSKSVSDSTYEWLRTATWEEFKKKQDAGLKIVIPIEGVPVGGEGKYTEDQFRKFTQLRAEGKLRNFSSTEFEHIVRLTASPKIAEIYVECLKSNPNPRGMTCWRGADDRLENGVVVYNARYYVDGKTPEPHVAKKNGFTVSGGTAETPLAAGDIIPFGGVAVKITRTKKSAITIVLNSKERGACNSVIFPAIGDVPPPFKIKIFSKISSDVSAHPQVTVSVDSNYKLIGGGAQVNWRGNGNLLVASYPDGDTSWTAKAKDHGDKYSDPSTITAWAIGLEDPKNQWEVKIVSKSESVDGGAVKSVTTEGLPPGFVRTGGGAASEFSGQGRLLTSSYPTDSTKWTVTDKDHAIAQGGTLTAYVIGVKSRAGPTPEVQLHTGTGTLAAHPTGSASLDVGYILTGGGARTSCAVGNLLTGSFPLDTTTWHAEAKDHGISCPSSIDVWAIGLKPPPGSISEEGGTEALESVFKFDGSMALSSTAVPAMRPTATHAPIPKSTYYFSREGDTFQTIGLRFYNNTDWKKLMNANPNVKGGLTIIPGTKILLPGK